jgi:hypothetical protein
VFPVRYELDLYILQNSAVCSHSAFVCHMTCTANSFVVETQCVACEAGVESLNIIWTAFRLDSVKRLT